MKKRTHSLIFGSFFEIFILVLSVVAVGFIIGNIERVGALDPNDLKNSEESSSQSTGGNEDTFGINRKQTEFEEKLSRMIKPPGTLVNKHKPVAPEKTGLLARAKDYLGDKPTSAVQGLAQGVTWAGTAYMATSVIGGMLGVDDEPWFKSAQ